MTQDDWQIVIVVLRHACFAGWFAFTTWYAISHRFEDTAYGINTFAVSFVMTSVFFLLAVSTWLPAPVLLFAQLPVYGLALVTAVQRLHLIRRTDRAGRKR